MLELLFSKVGMVLAIAVAVGGIIAITFAVLAREGGDPQNQSREVEALIPNRDAEVLRQQSVGIDLEDSMRYVISSFKLNGVEIPEDQYLFSTGTNRLTFIPGEGQVFEKLEPQRNCVNVKFHPVIEGPASTSNVGWCFQAL